MRLNICVKLKRLIKNAKPEDYLKINQMEQIGWKEHCKHITRFAPEDWLNMKIIQQTERN